MALKPIDDIHALQIQAGTLGRKKGHKFEDDIAAKINGLKYPYNVASLPKGNVFSGCPAELLLAYVGKTAGFSSIPKATAISTGALATSEEGLDWLSVNGVEVKKCKSDLVVTLHDENDRLTTYGISTKQCNNKNPTNAQLYFTTARAFSALLVNNGIPVSEVAVRALRQFCGDDGFRPDDDPSIMMVRESDPRRYFWEEIEEVGRKEWEKIFSEKQDEVTRLLLQKAYMDDPFVPDFILHKTKKSENWNMTEVAVYSIDELISLSSKYGGFWVKPYRVKKGSYCDPVGVEHHAPRFGIVQMQRGGQAQHPTQLQFNLQAGYFYKI
jgi:hypothetical protein